MDVEAGEGSPGPQPAPGDLPATSRPLAGSGGKTTCDRGKKGRKCRTQSVGAPSSVVLFWGVLDPASAREPAREIVYNPATGPELGARLPKPSSSTPISWASDTKSLACS